MDVISATEYENALLLKQLQREQSIAAVCVPSLGTPASNVKTPATQPPGAVSSLTPVSPRPVSAPKSQVVFDPLFGFDNLVDVFYFINPDMELYPWQAEELMRLSGYVTGHPDGPRKHFAPSDPFLADYVCANGSGKDKVLITTTAIGLPLLYKGVFVVITSSSHEQLKYQTENHIKRAIEKLNARAGFELFSSVEYYHRCPSRGGEIKLFVTDETGRAEGWHPLETPGQLVLIINEAKSISENILSALDRCWGYSHWLEISSPGNRRGTFYRNYKRSVKYPEVPKPFTPFGRQVGYHECPHITSDNARVIIDKHGFNSYIVQTSLLANFWEQEVGVVIPASLVEECENASRVRGSIGIGLDMAAGGDETVLIVRDGNSVIDLYAFREPDTTVACELIDARLDHLRHTDYVFNADDGGVGRGPNDTLTKLGWKIIRRHSQSAAYEKDRFANLGAELWWHSRDLFQAKLIQKPADEMLVTQLITRKNNTSEGLGKNKLDSKKRIKELGGASPDRADAFVLAFYSYRPKYDTSPISPVTDPRDDISDLPSMTLAEVAAVLRKNPLNNPVSPQTSRPYPGRHTLLTQ